MFLPQVVGCDYVDVDGEDVYPRTAIVGYINGTPAPWVAFVNVYMAGGIANARIDHRDRSADLQRVRRFPPAPRRNPASRSVPTLFSPPSLSSIVPFLFFAPPHPRPLPTARPPLCCRTPVKNGLRQLTPLLSSRCTSTRRCLRISNARRSRRLAHCVRQCVPISRLRMSPLH